MENTYEPQRAERDEYRTLSKAKRISAEKKPDYFLRLMLLQTAVCLAFVGAVSASVKIMPHIGQQIRNEYSKIMSVDMSVRDVWNSLTGKARYAYTPTEEEQEALPASATVQPTVAPTTTAVREVVTDDTGETVAVGEIIQGSGGGDISGKTAKDGTSFAPYYITAGPVMPVNGRVTSRFGYRVNPVSGNYGFHTGLDLACDEGTPIAAAFYGTVKETGESDVWGKYVLMEHSSGLQTYYCHCSEVLVNEGAVIRQGETLALVGTTGWSTGPHLHFEVRINDVRVNPELLLFGEESMEVINED